MAKGKPWKGEGNVPKDTSDIKSFIENYESKKRGEIIAIEIIDIKTTTNKSDNVVDFLKNIFKFKQ
jgi:hypothetical protein